MSSASRQPNVSIRKAVRGWEINPPTEVLSATIPSARPRLRRNQRTTTVLAASTPHPEVANDKGIVRMNSISGSELVPLKKTIPCELRFKWPVGWLNR